MTLPNEILWLNDAPLFIDEKQVEAFYDAILQPDFEEISRSFSDSINRETTFEGGITLGAALPWFVKSEGSGKVARKKAKGEEESSNWNRVKNPYRHLLALCLQYATQGSLRERLVFAGGDRCVDATGKTVDLTDSSFVQRSPRALIMLDLQPGTEFIPAALELTNGKVVRLFEEVARRFQQPGRIALPEYPKPSDPEVSRKRQQYWEWFIEFYDRDTVLEIVEDAVRDHPIAWIDYRFPFQGRFPHLHVVGRGDYETGVFGYQLISRGFKHGLRVVGTLKSEPDVNVLAIFER